MFNVPVTVKFPPTVVLPVVVVPVKVGLAIGAKIDVSGAGPVAPVSPVAPRYASSDI